ncbi:MAG: chromate transporter [Clostridia bacterium]|nr:chromate transporter [Clostridia bacterium]MBO5076267.1 chromate transporter [Clostridia bacterium]
MILLELLVGFLMIGCFSFGGAYAAIPLIREVVLSFGWLEEEKLSYMIAVSESTPGPIMVNMATYIGSVKAGVPGAIIATFAVVLPAFLIVIILMLLLKKLVNSGAFQATLGSLKSCVTGIILATGAYMILTNCIGSYSGIAVDYVAIILTLALGAVCFGSKKIMKKGLSPIILICIAGVAGILAYGW